MKTKIFLLSSLIFVLSACKKDVGLSDCDGDGLSFDVNSVNVCYEGELNTSSSPCDFVVSYDSTNFWGLTFNPNNSDELAFIYNKNLENGQICCRKLFIYDHKTNTKLKEINFPVEPYTQPRWGTNDYFIYGGIDTKIYKFKSDGTDFQYLIDGGAPLWDSTGEKFAFSRGMGEPIFIADEDGALLDSLSLVVNYAISDWSSTGKLLYDFSYFDFASDTTVPIFLINDFGLNIFRKRWGMNTNEIVTTSKDLGLGTYNIEERKFDLFKSNCSGRYYSTLDVSADKKYIATIVDIWKVIA